MIASQAQQNVSVFRENSSVEIVQTNVEQETRNALFLECVNDFKRNLYPKIQEQSLKGNTQISYSTCLGNFESPIPTNTQLEALFSVLPPRIRKNTSRLDFSAQNNVLKNLEIELKTYFEELGYTVIECNVNSTTFLVEKTDNDNDEDAFFSPKEKRNLVKIGEYNHFDIMRDNVMQFDLCLSW